jgi:hypothetical protein
MLKVPDSLLSHSFHSGQLLVCSYRIEWMPSHKAEQVLSAQRRTVGLCCIRETNVEHIQWAEEGTCVLGSRAVLPSGVSGPSLAKRGPEAYAARLLLPQTPCTAGAGAGANEAWEATAVESNINSHNCMSAKANGPRLKFLGRSSSAAFSVPLTGSKYSVSSLPHMLTVLEGMGMDPGSRQ